MSSKGAAIPDERVIEFLKTKVNVKSWIEQTLKVPLKEDLHESLKTGIVLGYLMREIDERSIPILHEKTSHAFKHRENISSFLFAIEEYGVPNHRLFMTNDLWNGTNMVAVVECIAELARIAESKGFQIKMKTPEEYSGPAIAKPTGSELADLKDKIARLKDKPRGNVKIKMSANMVKMILQVQAKEGIDWTKLEARLTLFQAAIRRTQQRRRFQKMVRDVSYREHVAKEILSTEQVYVKDLETAIKVYLKPLEEESSKPKSFISKDDIRIIFSDIYIVESVNRHLLKDLESRIKDWSRKTCIGDIFLEFVAHFKVYTGYLQNYNESISKINHLSKNEKFCKLMIECKKDPDCKSLDLASFLIKPVQRIPRYSLLLKDMAKHTWKTHPDHENLNKAFNEVEKVATFLNEKKKIAENSIKLLEISQHLEKCPINLIEATRRFIREAQLSDHKSVVYLFNDMIMMGTIKKKLKLGQTKQIKYADSFPIIDIQASSLPDEKNTANIIEIIRPNSKKLKLSFASNPDKLIWLKDINQLKEDLKKITTNKQTQIVHREIQSSGKEAEEILQSRKRTATFTAPSTPPPQESVSAPSSPIPSELPPEKPSQASKASTFSRSIMSRSKTTIGQGSLLQTTTTSTISLPSVSSSRTVSERPTPPPREQGGSSFLSSMFNSSKRGSGRTGTNSPHEKSAAHSSLNGEDGNFGANLSVSASGSGLASLSSPSTPVLPSVSGFGLSPLDSGSRITTTTTSTATPASLNSSDGMTLDEVKKSKFTLDGSKLETYLSSAEFFKAFGMSKQEFEKQPKWKQEREKKRLGLY